MRSLFVILDRSVVGELIRTDGGEHRFSYVGARTAPISLSMPVDGGQFRHRVVDPFLEGLLPDQASVREALAARCQAWPSPCWSTSAWTAPGPCASPTPST